MSDTEESNNDSCILELREAAYYGGGGGFSWDPTEVRDKPPTFRALGCPLDRVVGRRVVVASGGLGSYGMGGFGVFGLGLALTPDLALCPTYEARVREVVKCLEERNKGEQTMLDNLTQRQEEQKREEEEAAQAEAEEEEKAGEAGAEREDTDLAEDDEKSDDDDENKDDDEDKGDDDEDDEKDDDDDEDKEDEADPFTHRDEEKWQAYACGHEWLAFTTFSSSDYLQFQGKPYEKCGCTWYLIRDVIITDAHISDRTCRFEMKRWMPEHHYLPLYGLMAKVGLVRDGSYTPEPAVHGPHPLYALVLAQLRKQPQILLDSLQDAEQDDTTLGESTKHKEKKKQQQQCLPESVLNDVLAKPLGCITRVLELPADPVQGTKKWETKESLLDAWVVTRYDLFGC